MRIENLTADEREKVAECLEGEIEYNHSLIEGICLGGREDDENIPRMKSQVTAYAFVCGQLRQR